MLFKSARRDGVCLDNPAEFIGPVRAAAKSDNKRPFTIPELQAILGVADSEWRSLILFGLYTGQRLGDLVSLTWNNIDLEASQIRFIAAKTGRSMILPMAPALSRRSTATAVRALFESLKRVIPQVLGDPV